MDEVLARADRRMYAEKKRYRFWVSDFENQEKC
jgi:hypothetical protein